MGVQIWVSDVTRRLQWGHLPDMKLLLPTVEYLYHIIRHGGRLWGGVGEGKEGKIQFSRSSTLFTVQFSRLYNLVNCLRCYCGNQ